MSQSINILKRTPKYYPNSPFHISMSYPHYINIISRYPHYIHTISPLYPHYIIIYPNYIPHCVPIILILYLDGYINFFVP